EWQGELGNAAGITREQWNEVNLDRIYVFTPEGHVIDMTPGATPVDFAYRVHTEVGHKCRGAKVNGRVVPLNTTLQTGDQVEIITGDEMEPRREWLFGHLGYVSTSRARAKIRNWFGQREKEKNIEEGKKLLLDELVHLGIDQLDFIELINAVGYETPEALFVAIGAGELDAVDVVEAASELIDLDGYESQMSLGLDFAQGDSESSEVIISGLGDLPFELAACCRPVPGESIVGVIGDDRVVHIHRQDCLEALRGEIGRIIKVRWEEQVTRTFPVDIEVVAYDRAGLLFDITSILMQENTNVVSINTTHQELESRVNLTMTIEERSLNRLLKTLEKIEQLSNVISARRTTSSS
ncbi:MAG: bifunctional (p)ppGpp synthetase/guanosine-3',5'-bis(diphosphate) 3'-pyrophosphohydrolase, partial [Pseudomonadales bacterium]|nr:bifunctional (p)ppGpp synthetase/guanosine-3',5'-bis(diphosphate) 3'-pyrophosphohydrolase [Pseudomonadales bacterium]